MDYKKILFSLLLSSGFICISGIFAGEFAGAFKGEEEELGGALGKDEGRLGKGPREEDPIVTPRDDGGFITTGGTGLGTKVTEQDAQYLSKINKDNGLPGGGDDGASVEKPGQEAANVDAGLSSLTKEGPRPRKAGDGAGKGEGTGGEGSPEGGETSEAIKARSDEIDNMSDEELAAYKPKAGAKGADLKKFNAAKEKYNRANFEKKQADAKYDKASEDYDKVNSKYEDTKQDYEKAESDFEKITADFKKKTKSGKVSEEDADAYDAAKAKLDKAKKELDEGKEELDASYKQMNKAYDEAMAAGEKLSKAEAELKDAIKALEGVQMRAVAQSATSGAGDTGKDGGDEEKTPEQKAENEEEAAAKQQEEAAQRDAINKDIEEQNGKIDKLTSDKDDLVEQIKGKQEELASLKEKLRDKHPTQAVELKKEIERCNGEIKELGSQLKACDKDLKAAVEKKQGLEDKRDAIGKADGEIGPRAKERQTEFGKDWGKLKAKVKKFRESEGIGSKVKKYYKDRGATGALKDGADGIYKGAKKGGKWALQKTKKFAAFLWDQMKIGFAFMIPGDIVAAIQAAMQAAAQYASVTAPQKFAGITLYTISGLIPRADALNGIFLYTDTNNEGEYTSPQRRFFMSCSAYGDSIGQNWLGSGAVTYMIEFSTGLICDANGDPLVYGYPGVPLKPVPGFNYAGTSGNNTISTVVSEALNNVERDVSGGVKREVKVQGLLQGFGRENDTPSGNGTMSTLFDQTNNVLPPVFNYSLSTFTQGVQSSAFKMTLKQVEGLGVTSYLLQYYPTIFEAQTKGKSLDSSSNEIQLIEKLANYSSSLSSLAALKAVDALVAKGDYKFATTPPKGIAPGTNLLAANVFIYQTDDTPIVSMMKNAVPDGLKPHVHDYVMGYNSSNAAVPILVPMVNIPEGSASAATPCVVWGINPAVTYVVSLVSGASYCPGLIPLVSNGMTDYTNANALWTQVMATSGNSTAYGGIAGFQNQLKAMQGLAQFIIDKGPFQLNGMYKAYRVEGIEDLFDTGGLTSSDMQKAKSAILLGMAAAQTSAQIAPSDKIDIQTKQNYVATGIFVYRIDNALCNGTLPDYVIPVMVNSNGNYQIIPLGSQVVFAKDGVTAAGSVSSQVQALISLVTSRVYDGNYNPLPQNYLTNILVFQTPGTPLGCTIGTKYGKYTCPNGSLVEPNGENQPLATAFMETEFNPANQSSLNFSMPPYYFLMMPYDITPITPPAPGASATVFGNVGTLGTVTSLGEPLYEVLPENFTGIPWPSTIKHNMNLYEKFLGGFSSLPTTQVAAAIGTPKPTTETQILNTLLAQVKTIVQGSTFNPTDLTIAQVHDLWKDNFIKQLEGKDPNWIQNWEMGPYNIVPALPATASGATPATAWSIGLLNQECALNNHYIYTLTQNQTTSIAGLWVLAQYQPGLPSPILESSLTPLSVPMANGLKSVPNIATNYLVSITLPSIGADAFQQSMINYYNLQPRTDGNYYGVAPAQAGDQNPNLGNLLDSFSNIGQNRQDTTAGNALIDLLSGRVLILTQDANNQTYLLPFVNVQGYEITLDPQKVLKKFAHGTMDATLQTYIQQNITGVSGDSYTAYYGIKSLTLSRAALNSGNYIYQFNSSNPAKPIDYLTPMKQVNGAAVFNVPLTTDVQTMISLVDFEEVSPSNTPGLAKQYMNIKAAPTPKQRALFSMIETPFFNKDLMTPSLINALQDAKNKAASAIVSPPAVKPTPSVNPDVLNQNAIINTVEESEAGSTATTNNYFDPTTLTPNNLTHHGDNDTVYSGPFFLYNDSNGNYFVGIGEMSGGGDTATFDTYYCFSLQGFMGSSFPASLQGLKGPVGGYYAKTSTGKYALTQVVFGPNADHIASTYGVYVDPSDFSPHLGFPVSVKPLFMDAATDMNLQGGKNTGTFMRFIKKLPQVFEGHDYYLYENVAVPGLIASNSQYGMKMTPSAYLAQINPPVGQAYYLDLVTGLTYNLQGQPLPEAAQVYMRSDQSAAKFNPLITYGELGSLQMLVPFTNSSIVSSFVANNLAAPGQNEVFAMYATTIGDVVLNYIDPISGNIYSYSRKSSPTAAIDGNIYQLNAQTNAVVKIFNQAQIDTTDTLATASDMSKKIQLSNKNMVTALQDAQNKKYRPYTTVFTLNPLTLDVALEEVTTALILPTVTATHNIGSDKWTLSYTVTTPAVTNASGSTSPATTTKVNENYLSTTDANNNPLYQVLLLQGIGTCDATSVGTGQIKLTTLDSVSADNNNMKQQARNSFVLQSFDSTNNNFDTVNAVIAGGTIFRPTTPTVSTQATPLNLTNKDIGATVSYTVVNAAPFMPSFVPPMTTQNVNCYKITTVTIPTGASTAQSGASNYNSYFYAPGTVFAYALQYVSNPQQDFTAYYTAWNFEPEVSTEGTMVLANYLTNGDMTQLIPITVDKVLVDENLQNTYLSAGGTQTASVPVSLQEYITTKYSASIKPFGEVKAAIQAQVSSVASATTAAPVAQPSSATTSKSSNPYVVQGLTQVTQKKDLLAVHQQTTALNQAIQINKAQGSAVASKACNTIFKSVFSAIPASASDTDFQTLITKTCGEDFSKMMFSLKPTDAKLYYDPVSGYVVYKIGPYDQGLDFYNITGITEGYILMPMIFKDSSQGAPLQGFATNYRVSGIVFDTDGETIHEVISMKDLNKIVTSTGNLGALQIERQSAQNIIFDVNITLPKVPDAVFVPTTVATPTASTTTPPANTPTVVDNSDND